MTYLDIECVKDHLGQDAFDAAYPMPESASILEKHMEAAEAEVHSCICSRYETPVTDLTGIALIRAKALDLMILQAYKRFCLTDIPDWVTDCAKDARSWCEKVASGRLELGCLSELGPESGAGTGVLTSTCPPKFGKDCMKSF